MSKRKTFATTLSAVALCFGAFAADATPVLDGGWASDTVPDINVESANSPYVFELLTDAWFRITDGFLTDDVYTVFQTGDTTPLLVTSFQAFDAGFGDNAGADNGWTSASFSSAEVLLSAGSYSLEVFGDCAGGCPAGFYTRLDTATPVPVPAGLPLLLGGLAVLGALRQTNRKP